MEGDNGGLISTGLGPHEGVRVPPRAEMFAVLSMSTPSFGLFGTSFGSSLPTQQLQLGSFQQSPMLGTSMMEGPSAAGKAWNVDVAGSGLSDADLHGFGLPISDSVRSGDGEYPKSSVTDGGFGIRFGRDMLSVLATRRQEQMPLAGSSWPESGFPVPVEGVYGGYFGGGKLPALATEKFKTADKGRWFAGDDGSEAVNGYPYSVSMVRDWTWLLSDQV